MPGLKMDGKSAKVELARVLGKMQVMAYSFSEKEK